MPIRTHMSIPGEAKQGGLTDEVFKSNCGPGNLTEHRFHRNGAFYFLPGGSRTDGAYFGMVRLHHCRIVGASWN